MASITGIPSIAIPSGSDIFAATIYGCPISAYLSLEAQCLGNTDDVPACVSTQPDNSWDAACCGSISVFGSSLASCYSKNAPACFDTQAAATLTDVGTGTIDNPCAAYATAAPGGGSGSGSGGSSSGAGKTTSSAAAGSTAGSGGSSSTGSGGSAATTGSGSGTTAAAGGSTSSGSASAAATSSKSAAPKIGAGLKVWVGLALVGSVAILSL